MSPLSSPSTGWFYRFLLSPPFSVSVSVSPSPYTSICRSALSLHLCASCADESRLPAVGAMQSQQCNTSAGNPSNAVTLYSQQCHNTARTVGQFCNALHQVVVDALRDDRVVFVVGVRADELPHPLCFSQQRTRSTLRNKAQIARQLTPEKVEHNCHQGRQEERQRGKALSSSLLRLVSLLFSPLLFSLCHSALLLAFSFHLLLFFFLFFS